MPFCRSGLGLNEIFSHVLFNLIIWIHNAYWDWCKKTRDMEKIT